MAEPELDDARVIGTEQHGGADMLGSELEGDEGRLVCRVEQGVFSRLIGIAHHDDVATAHGRAWTSPTTAIRDTHTQRT